MTCSWRIAFSSYTLFRRSTLDRSIQFCELNICVRREILIKSITSILLPQLYFFIIQLHCFSCPGRDLIFQKDLSVFKTGSSVQVIISCTAQTPISWRWDISIVNVILSLFYVFAPTWSWIARAARIVF